MANQKISRKDFHAIYSSVCDSWKKKMVDILTEQQLNQDIEIDESTISSAYKEANPDQKVMLEKYFTIKSPKKIMDRIKDFNDILKELGKSYDEVVPWRNPANKFQRSQNAVAKIQCITQVYNQGVELNWNNSSEYKWYPWWRKTSGGWVLHGVDYDYSDALLGCGCYFVSRELCEDAIRKFKDIYDDYLPE